MDGRYIDELFAKQVRDGFVDSRKGWLDPYATEEDAGKKIAEEIDSLREKIESIQNQKPKICLMSGETLLMMISQLNTEDKTFRLNGMPVITNNRVEYGKIVIINEEDYEAWEKENTETRQEEPCKPIPKKYHCRVCGTPYDSRQEAKECQRTHEWQNRKGRK